MLQITLGSRVFSYQIIRKPIISLRLRLTSAKSFTVSAPRLLPSIFIHKFITDQSDWIIRHASLIKKSPALPSSLIILGQPYQLIINPSTRDSLIIFSESHTIHLNTKISSSAHLKKILDQKLRPLALKLIKSELASLKDQYGFKYGTITVRNQSSRFGSCSSRGNLNFNWQIIFFPPDLFRHVLLHELTHTIHHNHSVSFWKQLGQYDPEWRLHRLWLKKEGSIHFIL